MVTISGIKIKRLEIENITPGPQREKNEIEKRILTNPEKSMKREKL